ncbi:MAG: 23S rRNA (adenine(1618)-N(6))-methyltransferase RlmF [Aliiglaciecola sp.]|uniref:23S rRNA (adenine(1618)-N(6))-methyltransferase RlmF n=1 Tax=Aliiglaciecola sp. TaxID=1872441 RepID=UPI003297B1EF
MHPKNLHKNGYNFDQLVKSVPGLNNFVVKKQGRRATIDFANANAVKCLNQALLKQHYKVACWDIPEGFLCPPVPGRADYIHHIADLIATPNIKASDVRGLDIGVGANLIYPIIGSQSYGWQFVGSDISDDSLQSAKRIIANNSNLQTRITIRKQNNPQSIFDGLIQADDKFTFTMCNPPFHANAQAALAGNQQKNRNLGRHKQKRQGTGSRPTQTNKTHLNFAGQHNELWCKGGESTFIKKMIIESQAYAKQINWFTCLVSKKEHLNGIYRQLEQIQANDVRTIGMDQGSKVSRFIAWQF